jgi:hypothetical protein
VQGDLFNILDAPKSKIRKYPKGLTDQQKKSMKSRDQVIAELKKIIHEILLSLHKSNIKNAEEVGEVVQDIGLNFGFDLPIGKEGEESTPGNAKRTETLLDVEKRLLSYNETKGKSEPLYPILQKFLGIEEEDDDEILEIPEVDLDYEEEPEKIRVEDDDEMEEFDAYSPIIGIEEIAKSEEGKEGTGKRKKKKKKKAKKRTSQIPKKKKAKKGTGKINELIPKKRKRDKGTSYDDPHIKKKRKKEKGIEKEEDKQD